MDAPREPNDELLTTADAARLLGVHEASVARWFDAGKLGGFRTPGGHRRIYRKDVDGLFAPADGQASKRPARGRAARRGR